MSNQINATFSSGLIHSIMENSFFSLKVQIIFALLLLSASVHAQYAGYHPLLVEGKIWKTVVLQVDKDSNISLLYVNYKTEGTDEAGGKACMKLYRSMSSDKDVEGDYAFLTYMYEDGEKVFIWHDENWEPLFDFGLEVGDKFNGMTVKGKMETKFNGKVYPTTYIGSQTWMEGVGEINYGPATSSPVELVTDTKHFESFCYFTAEKNVIIFDMTDVVFANVKRTIETLGISLVVSPSAADAPLFDLQGRRLSAKPVKGMYIQDGRKYVVK